MCDLVVPTLPAGDVTGRQYLVCHDKGTYDAISITPHTAARDRLLYMDNVHRSLVFAQKSTGYQGRVAFTLYKSNAAIVRPLHSLTKCECYTPLRCVIHAFLLG